MRTEPLKPFELSTFDDMPADSVAMSASKVDVWSNGLSAGRKRTDTEPFSGAVALLVVISALLAFMAPMVRHVFKGLDTELLGVRRRANAFDEHTGAESRTLLLMILLSCLCEGILLAVVFNHSMVSNGKVLGLMWCMTVGYYIIQYVGYSTIGYAFSDEVGRTQWLKGFNMSQGLLGLMLLLPTIAVMYYPHAINTMVVIAALMYLMTRIAFLCKGFRIFYNNLGSLVYFILYLCAIEIVPVIIIVKLAQSIDNIY